MDGWQILNSNSIAVAVAVAVAVNQIKKDHQSTPNYSILLRDLIRIRFDGQRRDG
jgi:hypothetical protein